MDYPLTTEITLAPPAAFELTRRERLPFFLDSGMDPDKLGRYSFIGYDPFLVITSRGEQITVTRPEGQTTFRGNPFATLGALLDEYQMDSDTTPLPFNGGAVGYLSYDLGNFIEVLPTNASDGLRLPECQFGLYDVIIGFDNQTGQGWIISTGFPEKSPPPRARRARERLAAAQRKLARPLPPPSPAPEDKPAARGLRSGFTREDYLAAVEQARQYIIRGDIFEVNLSQRFEADLYITPDELFRRLRHINPAPFAAYLGFDDVQVVSASPERFLLVHGDRVETRPIKGTRPRGTTPEADQRLAAELLASPKDQAENMMIVDLERNDLGRVCRYGSVRVTELATLETFPSVFHLTSNVVGQLREDAGLIELLKATFPGGSITGAPKIRAMEIIDELEPTQRSVYTGSIGYLGFNGNADLNIAIRTMLVRDGRVYFQTGGAVVYDSDPTTEYRETLDKAYAMFRALGLAGIEEGVR